MKLDPAKLLGQTLAMRYQLVRQIGVGGMGAVFEALDMFDKRAVAVKVLHEAKPERVARLEREVTAMKAVVSPYVAASIDAGIDADTELPFHVMELLVGEPLSAVMERRQNLEPTTVFRIAAQAAEGLGLAHAVGVIHRDIKPENLFVAGTDKGGVVVKVLDFGLAKLNEEAFFGGVGAAAKLTKPRSLVGSPRYMSPEQARGTQEVDRRTDIWSLGVIMYEMLAGQSPHGEASSVTDRILRICVKEPAALRELVPDIPDDVEQIVMRAVTRDREHRYASAPAMREDLHDWLGGQVELDPEELA